MRALFTPERIGVTAAAAHLLLAGLIVLGMDMILLPDSPEGSVGVLLVCWLDLPVFVFTGLLLSLGDSLGFGLTIFAATVLLSSILYGGLAMLAAERYETWKRESYFYLPTLRGD